MHDLRRAMREVADRLGFVFADIPDVACASPEAAIHLLGARLLQANLLNPSMCDIAMERAVIKAHDSYHLPANGGVLLLASIPAGGKVIGGIAYSDRGMSWLDHPFKVFALTLIVWPRELKARGIEVAEKWARLLTLLRDGRLDEQGPSQ